ncbi:MAG TPA: LacI family DNA-binding transcriptional regulator [Verrucomicrobiae bacterium]|nr:LacI family DNA-binding transcriptional regulator [Verrucomicrobiae bacterium]
MEKIDFRRGGSNASRIVITKKRAAAAGRKPGPGHSASARNGGNGAPNIRDVARQARVSVATVSFVLNAAQRHRIRAKTQERVLAAVKQLGYSPNAAARNLAMGHSHILGVIVSDIRNPFFPEITAVFQETANLNDMEAIVMNSNYDAQRMKQSVNRLLALQVPGVAILTSQIESSVMDNLAERGICAVYLDLGRVDACISNIAVDYESGIIAALEHVRALGHERIGFIGGAPHLRSAQRRKRAFLAGAEKFKSLQTQAVDSNFSVQGGYVACSKLLSGLRPSAIIAANDLMAIGAMHAAYDRKVRIPGELSIVGFDDIRFAEHMLPPLTTVAVPRSDIGRIAFETLRTMISDPAKAGAEHHVHTHLVVRDSTAAMGGE